MGICIVCHTCNGTGTIMRPEVWVQTVVEDAHKEGKKMAYEARTVQTRTGGIDACPECAVRAEFEYRSTQQ